MFSRCITFETRDIIQLIGSVVEFPGVLGCLGKTYFQADIPFGFMFSLQCLMYAAEKKQATSLGSLLGPLLWSLVKCSGGGGGSMSTCMSPGISSALLTQRWGSTANLQQAEMIFYVVPSMKRHFVLHLLVR